MIKVSIIYLCFTILLSMIESIRIYVEKGKKDNINHTVSTALAIVGWVLTLMIVIVELPEDLPQPFNWLTHSVYVVFSAATCALVRLAAYNVMLNFFRILSGTNPTARLDYVSAKTSSKTDKNIFWSRFSFWQQRGIATFAWALTAFAYYKLEQYHILGL